MVELEAVSHAYARRVGGRVHALREVDIEVADGELVVLLGPASAGKSTLLRLLWGDVRATQGRVRVDGQDLAALRPRALRRLRRCLGIAPEEPRLLADRTAFGNLTFVLRALGLPAAEARARALRALRDTGLAAKANVFPGELAAGERRRLGLARALAHGPRLLLVDEPAPPADPTALRDVAEVLRQAHAGGTTVIVATRLAELPALLRGRTVTLEAGRLHAPARLHATG